MDLPSSPAPGGGIESDLAYYKAQYEQLELELQEFQASSRELEAELEKDIEAAEKKERQLREKVETLGYEVEEWKTKYKQSKTEANNAQNALQKEITSLRDTNRTLQLRLRDIEVANDDYERKARNTESSLENLESKYNQGIERAVMLEEEIKIGEQEREALRIETQRLRDEFSDLKIEAEIVQEKLRNAEATIEAQRSYKPHHLATDNLRPPTPASEVSTTPTTLSSPTASTPPPKSSGPPTVISDTPPSPPLSEVSASVKNVQATPGTIKRRPSTQLKTPRTGTSTSTSTSTSTIRAQRHSRAPSIPAYPPTANGRTTPSITRNRPSSTTSRTSTGGANAQQSSMPRSGSLYQLQQYRAKMAKIEERVQHVKSKLPAPKATPPRASPRSGSALGHHSALSNNVTVRSSKKRNSGGTTTSSLAAGDHRHSVSRLSFGLNPQDRAPSATGSRPSSRASAANTTQSAYTRPPSRSSITGARTPGGTHSYSTKTYTEGTIRRPRSSMSGLFHHGHSASVSNIEEDGPCTPGLTTPSFRRSTILKDVSSIPTPSGMRRQSGGPTGARRQSLGGVGEVEMPPPPPVRTMGGRKLAEVEETY